MNPDLTIYGRFGTRSERPGGRRTSRWRACARRWRRPCGCTGTTRRSSRRLAGKQVKPARFKTPRDYPSLSGKYGELIDYEGKRREELHALPPGPRGRAAGLPHGRRADPRRGALPYPDPAVLGLKMDPEEMATVERVARRARSAERRRLPAGRRDRHRWRANRCCRSPTSSGSCTTPRPTAKLPAPGPPGGNDDRPDARPAGGLAARRHLLAGDDLGPPADGPRRDEARRSSTRRGPASGRSSPTIGWPCGSSTSASTASTPSPSGPGSGRATSSSRSTARPPDDRVATPRYTLRRKQRGDRLAVTVLRDGARTTLSYALP